MNSIVLSDGHTVPSLGLGTWELRGDTCRRTVAQALALGYTHIDTAVGYDNHAAVGAGIRDAGVDRRSIFLTTKIPKDRLSPAQVAQTLGQALKDLRTSYVDLLLIHWPSKKTALAATLAAFGDAVAAGKVRSIGVSNFNSDLLHTACNESPLPIVTNQVEFHPYLYQRHLLDDCRSLNVTVTAYSPLARGRVLQDPVLTAIGGGHRVGDGPATAAQIAVAWLLAKQIVVIPKTADARRLAANLSAAEIALSPAEIATIDALDRGERIIDGEWKDFPF